MQQFIAAGNSVCSHLLLPGATWRNWCKEMGRRGRRGKRAGRMVGASRSVRGGGGWHVWEAMPCLRGGWGLKNSSVRSGERQK